MIESSQVDQGAQAARDNPKKSVHTLSTAARDHLLR
jgi:hypothetical protein